jgi:4-cresol dehydrogenase (hydroxylating)
VAAARHAVRTALRRCHARTSFISAGQLAFGARLARLLGPTGAGRRLRARVALGEALMAMNRGQPNGRFLAGAYWRRQGGLPAGFPQGADPAQDGCGLLWLSPVLPLRGADLLEVHALAEPLFRRFGFDLFCTFSMINERSLGAVLTIAYDQDDPAEVQRAHQCYRTLFDTFVAGGFLPYRVGHQSMGALDPHGDSFWRTVRTLKEALDPDGILAPGRYEPWRAGLTEVPPPAP